jgi:mRNA interferase RelE/StbE
VSYRVVLRPAAVRALQRMPEKISVACWEFIHGPLAENPHRVGKPLLEPLAPQYSARRGEYRVLYLIEDEQVTIIITRPSRTAPTHQQPLRKVAKNPPHLVSVLSHDHKRSVGEGRLADRYEDESADTVARGHDHVAGKVRL